MTISKLDQIRALGRPRLSMPVPTSTSLPKPLSKSLSKPVDPAPPKKKASSSYARVKRWREKHPEEYRAQQREVMRKRGAR